MQNNQQLQQQRTGALSLITTLPLKNQDQSELMAEICKLLTRLVKIYQVPNIDNEALVYLSEWMMTEYQHHDFALIMEALKYPPKNRDNTWRLTPDTIRFWIDTTMEKRFDREQVEASKKRQESETIKTPFSPETEKLIQDFKNMLLDGISRVPEMTPEEIKANGQVRPKAFKVPSTDSSYVKEWADKIHKYQEQTYRDRHPDCTDEEVQRFLKKV